MNYNNPSMTDSSMADPSMTDPSMRDPSMTQNGMTYPSMYDPSMTDPSMQDPSMTDPNMHDPSMHDPSMTDPSMHDPSMSDPSMHDPSMSDPSMHDPSMHDPSMHDPSMSDPSMSDPSMSDPSMTDINMSDMDATIDLNDQFINSTGGNLNEAGFKLSISRAADGSISFAETLDPIDTLANHTSITFSSDQTFGTTTVDAGTYELFYHDHNGSSSFNLYSLNSEGTNSQGTEVFSNGGPNYYLDKGYSNGFEEFEAAINDVSILPGAPKTMLFDDYSTNPFVIDITQEYNSAYYNDGGVKSTEKLDTGTYLVNVKADNVITLTEIVPDTDYDGISELATEYTLWDGNGNQEYHSFKIKY